ncbi:hypothetical protein TNCV_3924981 [Trichonephila clavipes]|nr:hypothetical protein TNCV_3924981 [Trichonephila clavipes]
MVTNSWLVGHEFEPSVTKDRVMGSVLRIRATSRIFGGCVPDGKEGGTTNALTRDLARFAERRSRDPDETEKEKEKVPTQDDFVALLNV